MSTLQTTFNAVIEAGLYQPHDPQPTNLEFMCFSLKHARKGLVITTEQVKEAQQAIEEYISELTGEDYHCDALSDALDIASLPSTASHRTAIYLDWANRPYP